MIELNRLKGGTEMKSGRRIDTVEDKQHASQMHLSPTYENTLDQPSTVEAPKDVKLELGS